MIASDLVVSLVCLLMTRFSVRQIVRTLQQHSSAVPHTTNRSNYCRFYFTCAVSKQLYPCAAPYHCRTVHTIRTCTENTPSRQYAHSNARAISCFIAPYVYCVIHQPLPKSLPDVALKFHTHNGEMILDLNDPKTREVRGTPIPERYLNVRMGILTSGRVRGKLLIGEMVFTGCGRYADNEEFAQNVKRHKITSKDMETFLQRSTNYWWQMSFIVAHDEHLLFETTETVRWQFLSKLAPAVRCPLSSFVIHLYLFVLTHRFQF